MSARRGGRRKGSGRKPFLKQAGISKAQAHRWRAMAEVPEAEIRRLLAEANASGRELTSASVYRLAQAARRREAREWSLLELHSALRAEGVA